MTKTTETEAKNLSYPSPLLGIPKSARARDISRVFDHNVAGLHEARDLARSACQTKAAEAIAPIANNNTKMIQEVKKLYRDTMNDATRNYRLDVQAAQGRRDKAEAAAKKQQAENLELASKEFTEATQPVERELSRALFMIEEETTAKRGALLGEFNTYHQVAEAAEKERAEEDRRRADALVAKAAEESAARLAEPAIVMGNHIVEEAPAAV